MSTTHDWKQNGGERGGKKTKLMKRQLFHKKYNQRNKFSGEEVSSSLRLSRESVVSWVILKANNMWALGVKGLQHNNIHGSFFLKKY